MWFVLFNNCIILNEFLISTTLNQRKINMFFSDRPCLKNKQHVENLQEPVLQLLFKYSKLYHPEEPQRFAHFIGRLTELRTLSHRHSEILSTWKTKDPRLVPLFSEKWNLYALYWKCSMLRFVSKFQNHNWMTDLKTVIMHHHKMEKWRAHPHQILWNFRLSIEEHPRILLNGAMGWNNPCTWEVEAIRSRVQGHPGLYSKTSSQKKKEKNWWSLFLHESLPEETNFFFHLAENI